VERNGAMVSYAQNREDVLLARVFHDVAAGFYVDVGANDPEHCSVTKHFYDRGWSGINVEPGRVVTRLAAARPRDINLNVAASDRAGRLTFYEYPEGVLSGLSSLHAEVPGDDPELAASRVEREVEVLTLRDIFEQHAPARIDFLSVDVEQHERQVLLGNDWGRYRPRVVLVEATQPRTPVPSFESWEGILLEARYDFVHFDGLNRYYLRREDAALRERFAAPVCVFDDYVLAETVELHDRITGLLAEVGQRQHELAESRLETEQWRENASEWCERAGQARQETAQARDDEAQARADLSSSRLEAERVRQERALVEGQLRQRDAECAATRADRDEARRLLTAAEVALGETRGQLEDALRFIAEQAEALRATSAHLASAHQMAASLAAQVEDFERLGARPLALLRRWARFRDGHPKLMRALKRVTR
jgi:FkbM family methyltransferase